MDKTLIACILMTLPVHKQATLTDRERATSNIVLPSCIISLQQTSQYNNRGTLMDFREAQMDLLQRDARRTGTERRAQSSR